ncbi:MAG: PAS domain S-box protein [Deltaproteobacteria bacterium]|uniref:histidine kinase n=1 Tax=Candidatus Zymogenus saltonus TaxID=2844893 RepID=A0A9D8KGC3_9DELT|nr:PAS domain S-box protein [Candidatus Zymogenus saltonus]
MEALEKLKEENFQLKKKIEDLTRELDKHIISKREKETILQAVEDSLGGIAIIDRDWKLKYVNSAVVKMWNYDYGGEMIGRDFVEFFTERSEEDLNTAIEDISENGYWQGELIGRRKDGSTFFVLMSQSAVKDEGRDVSAIVASCIETTEYKKALRDVVESEMRYRITMDHLGDIIFVLNTNLDIVLVNSVMVDWYRDLGLKRKKMIGKNVFDLLPFLPDKIREECRAVFDTGQTIVREDEFSIEGNRYIMDMRIIPIIDGGEVNRIVTVMRDITVKKVVEEEFLRSEEKYRLIADNVPVGIFIHVNGEIIYCGREGAHLLGYDEPEELVGRNVIEFIHEDSRELTIERASRRAKGEDVPSGYEIKMIKKNGEVIPILIYGNTLEYLGENAIQGVIIDISERKKVEEEREKLLVQLKDSEERYRTLIETSNDVICVVKYDKIAFFNKRLPDMLGFTEDEIKRMNFVNFIHPDDIEMVRDMHLRRMRGEGVPSTYEFRGVKRNGDVIPVEINVATIEWEGGPAALCFIRNIKERKEAEEALRESEGKWRNLFENSIDSVFTVDVKGNFTSANPAMEALTGYKIDELIGRSFKELLIPEEVDKVLETYNILYRAGMPVKDFVLTAVRKDGEKRLVEGNSNVIKKGEDIIGFQGTFGDITEKRKTEEALVESEKKYRDLVENIDDMIYIADGEGKFKFYNKALVEFAGYTEEDFVGKNFKDLITPESYEYAAEIFKRQLRGEDVGTFEFQFIDNKGNLKVSEMRERLIWEGDRIIEVHGIGRDITERRMAEEMIRESEEKFRNMFESSKDVIYLTNIEGEFLDINPAAEEIFGYGIEELKDRNVKDLYKNKKDRDNFQREIQEKGFVKDYSIVFKKKDGTALDCLLTSTLRRGKDGSIVGYQGIIRDITERKQLEEQLLRAQKMKAIGTLAGGMAHNFNNILVGIMGYSEYLLGKRKEGDPDYKALKTIHESTVKASELTRQLLNIARGGDYKRVKVNMNSVVKRVIPLVTGTIDKTIEVVVNLEKKLCTAEGDVGQLEQCLLNLCINSRDAMPGGGKIIIETNNQIVDEHFVKTHLDAKVGNYVVLSVTDTGTGIAPDIIDHIFEPFFTTKKHAGGSGMGLATVYGIVKNLQGIITVYSEVGEGTTFRLYFPAIEEEVEENDLTYEDASLGGDETILLVDDEKVVRDMWGEILNELGYEVIISEGGKEVIDIIEEKGKEIDLIILDVVMPDMGGGEILEKVKEMEPDIRVLLSSGYSENGQVGDIIKAGADGFIQKPVSILNLTKKIREIFNHGD